ncbi:MAG: DUF6159 family protein [bacterium]
MEEQQQQAIQEMQIEPEVKIGKFKASKMLVVESWNILKQDKEMMLFPIFSVITNVVCFVLILVAFFFLALGGNIAKLNSDVTARGLEIALTFVLYFVSISIATFFQAGVVSIAQGRMKGEDLSFSDGFNNAIGHIGKIVVWALISATVGTILRFIAERSKLLGKIIVSLLGSAWSILTFFVVPVIVSEELSIKDSLKKSASIIGKTWGEAVIINIGVGLYFMLLSVIGIAVFVAALFVQNIIVIGIVSALLVLYLMALMVISSTLDTIFKIVLYEYANTGKVPQGFSPEVIAMAFGKK